MSEIKPTTTAGAEPARASRPRTWRSLEELAETPQFRERLEREFPRHAAVWDGSLDRRRFLTVAGASLGLAGLTACTKQPAEYIVPYVRQPEELVPGNPLFFATTMPLLGYGHGLLAESHMGRPTKLEGNPEHPASLGRTHTLAQASVLNLYDPDRSQAIVNLDRIRGWEAFVTDLSATLTTLGALGGEGLRILTGTVTSPTLAALLGKLLDKLPAARWHQFEPAGYDHQREGLRRALGRDAGHHFDLSRADVVVAVDSDFLYTGPGAVRYAKDFAARRRVADPGAARSMSRLYSVASELTTTDAVADHRLALPPSGVGHFITALAARMGVGGATAPVDAADGELGAWVEEVAADLQAHRGRSLVVAGEYADPEVHVLANAINGALGNVGATVHYTEPVEAQPADQDASFAELLTDMRAGRVDTVVFLGTNPVYAAAADQDVVGALENVRLRIHLGPYQDETARYCQWHVPESHYLESWGDARAYDGTASLAQPLIEPLYESKTALEVVAALLGRAVANDRELVEEHWKERFAAGGVGHGEPTFERFWRRAVHDGVVAGTAAQPIAASVDGGATAEAASTLAARRPAGLELLFRPDPSVLDGSFANNAWLQECPRPITKLTWDNALLISPATAREYGLSGMARDDEQGQEAPLARLQVGDEALEVPVWQVPGQADNTLVLHLGQGRERCGEVAVGAGVNAYRVRPSTAPWRVSEGVDLGYAGATYPLASTQDHHSLEGRDLIRMADLDHYLEDPVHAGAIEHHGPTDVSLMPEYEYDTYAWGMSIDLTTCTGCNACLVACQSENNIPAVGKDQVLEGREMHWIRIDRYYHGFDADQIDDVLVQPVPCMQCEQAPCEVVCPVAATVHSDEGLNDMVYNRCVGTRYCSNNCPYKVRRFNFLLYQDFETPSLKLMRNPDVTVRSRGVMEKCTYCVQRINQARIVAKREQRTIRDGEIVTACQGACPSDAIVFGDLNNPDSDLVKLKASPLDFSLLELLGTRPRTTYLGRIRNRNQKLLARLGVGGADDHEAHEEHHG